MVPIKSEKEIEIMREGGARHAYILREIADRVEPGISTLYLEEEALRLTREFGDKPAHLNYTPPGASRPFPAALCVSINDEIVHGIPNENVRVLKAGDIVAIDFSLEHGGLITDAAISVPVGIVDDQAKKLISITKEALEAGIAMAQPGHTVGHIGQAISKVVKTGGFSVAEGLAGHGVGYKIHEEPFVPNVGRAGKGENLLPGMVIAIEPMVNAGKGGTKLANDGYTILTRDGSRSAHFEHTVAITEKGPLILTQLQ